VTSPPDGLDAGVRDLVLRHIASIEQLEVLLLLRQAPTLDWTPDAVASILNGHPVSVADRMAALERAGFLRRSDTSDVRYRYSPGDDLGRQVDGLAAAYKERRVTVVSLIASKPLENMRAFSDAFRVRPPEKP